VKKKSQLPKSNPQDSNLATQWQQRFSIAKSNQTKLFTQFSDWYDIFNARIDPRVSNWRSKPFMPIVAQQVWALVAKFSSMVPTFEVQVNGDDVEAGDDDQRAALVSKKLEYDFNCPLMDEPMRDKVAASLIDACVTGTGLAKVPWRAKTQVRYERPVNSDTGIADLTKEKKFEKRTGYNDLEPVNIFNVFPSPATDKLNRGWLILRDFVPISELKATDDAMGGGFYNNLAKLSGKPSYGDFATYNYSRNRLMSDQEPSDATTDIATIYECYEGDNIYIFGENKDAANSTGGWVLLRQTKNYYWHGKWPLVKFHIKKRPFSFWGQGLAELTYRLQVIYNDVFAHYLDAWNLSVNPSFWVSEDSDVDDFIVEPGSLNYYNGQTPPAAIAFAKPEANSLEMIVQLLNQSIEGVTASSYATGLPSSSTDKTKGTATGIAKLTSEADDIISYMKSNFTQSLTQMGKMWLSNNQQFIQKPQNLSMIVKGQKQKVKVTPDVYQGDLDLTINENSLDPASAEDRMNKFMAYQTQLLQMQQASLTQAQNSRWALKPLYIDFATLSQDFSDIMGHPNYDKLLINGDEVQKAIESSQTPMIMPNERVMLTAQDLLPTEMAQLLQRNGIQPDQARTQGAVSPGDQVALADAKATLAKSQPQPQTPMSNPGADQATVNMAHELVGQGHLHPGIIDHLPPMQPQLNQEPQVGQQGN
jgi:hypothetical protein